MNKIIKQLVENNISFESFYNIYKEEPFYKISGFYKSGEIILNHVENSENLIAKARYNQHTIISDIEDLVKLNYSWWNSSKDRHNDWNLPEQQWVSLMTNLKLDLEEE